jgi:hypothetical protein
MRALSYADDPDLAGGDGGCPVNLSPRKSESPEGIESEQRICSAMI